MRARLPLVLPAALWLSGCALHHTTAPPAPGITACAPAAEHDLLSAGALQCWLEAPHGRWRILSHESHFDVLVVHTEAHDRRDAADIAHRIVDHLRARFSEILVYTQQPTREANARILRVEWTRAGGFDTIEFVGPARR